MGSITSLIDKLSLASLLDSVPERSVSCARNCVGKNMLEIQGDLIGIILLYVTVKKQISIKQKVTLLIKQQKK